MTDSGDPTTIIPARRLAPKDHLRRAALSGVGSAEERYHLDAAIGEALARIEQHLAQLARRWPPADGVRGPG